MNKIIANISKIQSLQSSAVRYKLVICQVAENELMDYTDVWNVGYSMAQFIQHNRESENLAMEFADECVSQALSHIVSIDGIGSCLIMKNIGILFEKSLQFNIQSFVKRYSQNNVLVLLTTGLVEDNKVFISSEKSNYYINISEINNITI